MYKLFVVCIVDNLSSEVLDSHDIICIVDKLSSEVIDSHMNSRSKSLDVRASVSREQPKFSDAKLSPSGNNYAVILFLHQLTPVFDFTCN